MMVPSYATPHRGAAIHGRPFGEFDACDGGWEIDGEPYTRAPGTQFSWWRARMLGGRTNHWGRISLRFGPDDFRGKSIDGLGDDWPISYDDVKPYYDNIDRFIGLYGSNEGLRNHPDGIFMPPPKPRCYELLVKKASDKLNITCIPARLSVITKPLPGRQACHYCGQCNRGCAGEGELLEPRRAHRAGAADGQAHADHERDGARGHRRTGRSRERRVVHRQEHRRRRARARQGRRAGGERAGDPRGCCSTLSRPQFPNGLANSSGIVGQVSHRHDRREACPDSFRRWSTTIPHNHDGVGGMHVYMPWWLDNKKLDFPRGYHIEVYGGAGQPASGFGGGIQRRNGGGYGKQLKADYRKYYGASIGFDGRGEMIPNDDSYCELDPNDGRSIRHSRAALPLEVHRLRVQPGEAHAGDLPLADRRDGRNAERSPMPTKEQGYGLADGGTIIHELGGARMGNDPKTSVVNANCQAHDVKNLFVADGSPFVSQADKNPTWTILALSWRTSDYIAAQRKAGAL